MKIVISSISRLLIVSTTTILLATLTNYVDGLSLTSSSSRSSISNEEVARNNNSNNSDQQYFASELTTRATASYMRRHMLDNNTNVTCNDGTRAGYYIRQNNNSQRWLIFLEGGWHCFNEKSCQQRWLKMKHFMTSKHWPELKNGEGILSSNRAENPQWWDANHVFVPYCSSDSWSGQFAATLPGQLSFMGSRILDEVINSLLMRENGLKQARFVLLAGSSAGAAGVIVNLDRIAAMIHASVDSQHRRQDNNGNNSSNNSTSANKVSDSNTAPPLNNETSAIATANQTNQRTVQTNGEQQQKTEVRGLVDSGWFLDNEPFDLLEQNSYNPIETGAGEHHDGEQVCDEPHACAPVQSIKLAMRMWNGRVPDACKEQYSSEPWRCYFGYRAYETLKTPLFVVQWLFDQAQLMVDNVGQPETTSQWNYVHKMSAQLRATLENVSAVFAPSCFSHTILTKSDWFRVKVNGVSLAQALQYWEAQKIEPKTFNNSHERTENATPTSISASSMPTATVTASQSTATNNYISNLSDLRPSAYHRQQSSSSHNQHYYHSTPNQYQNSDTAVAASETSNHYLQSQVLSDSSGNTSGSSLFNNNNRLYQPVTMLQSESVQARLHPTHIQATASSQTHNRKRGNKGKNKRKNKNPRNKQQHHINNNNSANYTNINNSNANSNALINNKVKTIHPDLSIDHLMNRNEMNQQENYRQTRMTNQNSNIRLHERRKSSPLTLDRRTKSSYEELTYVRNDNKQNLWLVDSCTWPQCNQDCPSIQNV